MKRMRNSIYETLSWQSFLNKMQRILPGGRGGENINVLENIIKGDRFVKFSHFLTVMASLINLQGKQSLFDHETFWCCVEILTR